MKIACWNTEWHGPKSWQWREMAAQLGDHAPEIICLPEAYTDQLGEGWHGVFSEPDYGYPLKPGRRKVTLWSRQPWTSVDEVGSSRLPSGRFISGLTQTSMGPIRVVGVCVPWARAHVSNGRRDRKPWEDHLTYLEALPEALPTDGPEVPQVLIGDINQRIPRKTSPMEAFDALQGVLGHFGVWTSGTVPGLDHQPVCHIAGSEHLKCSEVVGLARASSKGNLSDHDGLLVRTIRDVV